MQVLIQVMFESVQKVNRKDEKQSTHRRKHDLLCLYRAPKHKLKEYYPKENVEKICHNFLAVVFFFSSSLANYNRY